MMLRDTQSSTPRARACGRRPGQRLTKRARSKFQRQFIETFGHSGIVQAMTDMGLSRFTLYSWLRGAEFKKQYETKLASYRTLHYEEPTAEEWEEVSQHLRMLPAWKLIQQMKMRERMKARQGQPHDIFW